MRYMYCFSFLATCSDSVHAASFGDKLLSRPLQHSDEFVGGSEVQLTQRLSFLVSHRECLQQPINDSGNYIIGRYQSPVYWFKSCFPPRGFAKNSDGDAFVCYPFLAHARGAQRRRQFVIKLSLRKGTPILHHRARAETKKGIAILHAYTARTQDTTQSISINIAKLRGYFHIISHFTFKAFAAFRTKL